MPEPQPLPEAIAAAVGDESRAHRPRAAGPPRRPGAAIPTCSGCAAAPLERAPDAVVVPADAAAGGRACSRSARARGSRWSRSAAAPASSAGSTRSPAPHGRVIALDLRRMRSVAVDPISHDGHARARACAAPRPRGRWASADSRSATSRSRSSTRPSAASPPPARPDRRRAGYGRFDEIVTSLVDGDADRGAADARRRRTPRPGPALRELVVGSEGVLGVITEVTREGAPGPGRAPLRGLGRRRTSPPGAS